MSAGARRFSDAIAALGGAAYILRGESRLPFTASVQPRLTGAGPGSGPLGLTTERLYNLYCAADETALTLAPGDAVEYRGRAYTVARAEPYTLQGEDVYVHAILR